MYTTSTEVIINIIILSSILIFALSSFIILFVSVYKKKQLAYINEINALKIEHENKILKAQIEIQEQTFQNIARDLHDNVGQKLSFVKLQIISIQETNSFNIIETADIIGNAIDDIRNLSRTLSSDIILGNGMIEAIKFEVKQLVKTNIFKINFAVFGETIFLDSKRELILFRIVQEGLHNIVKHANAKSVSIVLEYINDRVNVNIQDDGIGFKKRFYKGQGLINIEARAKLLGGSFEISSTEFSGASLKVSIPINDNITTL